MLSSGARSLRQQRRDIRCASAGHCHGNQVWPHPRRSARLAALSELLAERGILFSYETVRRWGKKFGASSSLRPDPGRAALPLARCRSEWRGARHPRSASARCQRREALLQTLLKGLQYLPRVIVTDKLRSYGVARRQLLPGVEHRQSRYLNNRAGNSHRPTRRRERQMQRFKSSEQAQDFLSAHSFIYGHFHPRRHQLVAHAHHAIRSEALEVWRQETCAQRAA